MSFSDIEGAPVIRVSKPPFDQLESFVNSELSEDDGTAVKKSRIADIALAVGIKEETRVDSIEDSEQTFNLGSVDNYGVLKTIIEERHPDAAPDELRSLLVEYLEGGLQEISEQIENEGVFRYHEYLDYDD
jgi:hypothetical protein